MIHQLQFGSDSTNGPVLVPMELPIAAESEGQLLHEPIQLDLMLLDGSNLSESNLNGLELDSPALAVLELDADGPVGPGAAKPVAAEPIAVEAIAVEAIAVEAIAVEPAPTREADWPVADWMLQSVDLDSVGATHYVVGAPQSRRRSSPPLELIGAGVLGATLLSGFAIADNAKQVAQTPASMSPARSQAATGGLSRGGQSIGSSATKAVKPAGLSIQPEMIRPEMALPPPPVMVSKNLGSMAGLSTVPLTAVTSTTGSMTTGSMTTGSMTVGSTGDSPLGLTTASRSLRPIQLAEPTLVSVARSQGAIESVALPEPPMPSTESIAEGSQQQSGGVTSIAAVNPLPTDGMPIDRPMVSPVTSGGSAQPERVLEIVPDRMPAPSVDRAAAPLLSPSGIPLADPVVPMPQASLPQDSLPQDSLGVSQGAIPLAVVPPEFMAAERSATAKVMGIQAVSAEAPVQGVRSLSQAEAMAVLGARSDSEMGRFIHQSLNARDYAAAAQAQSLATVPPFGFVDYQNQRIVLPSDLTAVLPGAQLQSMGG
jgi:hypothetical protein